MHCTMATQIHKFVSMRRFLGRSFLSTSPRLSSQDWRVAINEGERVVGYPTSYLNLRCLLSDEMSNVALFARKLVGTGHPLLKTIKRLIYDSKQSVQTRGLVILLLSKAAIPLRTTPVEIGCTHDITQSQRSLAEIAEMVHMAYLIHRCVLNTSAAYFPETDVLHDMKFGNKIAVLCGDYLLATASASLANTRNNKAIDLIATAISHFTDAEFLGKQDRQGQCFPHENLTINDWEQKNMMAVGSLMANSCVATLELEPHDEPIKEHAYNFGKHIALAWQVHADLQPFVDHQQFPVGGAFDLMSAPVIFHLQHNPFLLDYLKDFRKNVNSIDYKKVHDEIVKNDDGVERSQKLTKYYVSEAESALAHFPSGEATEALKNILQAL